MMRSAALSGDGVRTVSAKHQVLACGKVLGEELDERGHLARHVAAGDETSIFDRLDLLRGLRRWATRPPLAARPA